MNEDRLGEVIESMISEFTAQSYDLYQLPSLGSLVKTKNTDLEIFGIVYKAGTSGIEPGRNPIARGKNEVNEEAIYQSNPQLFKLLRSDFGVLNTAHKYKGKLYRYLPPQPARIHSFVHRCSSEEVKELSQSFTFLNIIFNAHLSISAEELVAASLREMSLVYEDKRSFLVSAGKVLASILGGQYQRLKVILGSLQI